MLFEKHDLFVDDNEAPPPDPFENVYDDHSISSFHAPQDLPDTTEGLVPSFDLVEGVPKTSQIRIIFEKCDLFVDDNEAPPPDPFENVYDDDSLSDTTEGLVTSFDLEEGVPKTSRIPSILNGRISFKGSGLEIVNIEVDYTDDDSGLEKKMQFIIKSLPDGINYSDFFTMMNFSDVIQSVLYFSQQARKSPPTHITINVSPVTYWIMFERCQLEVDNNEAPPPEPFDLVEQCDDREDSSYGMN